MTDSEQNMRYEVSIRRNHVTYKLLTSEQEDICECEISVDKSTRTWNISAWFTNERFKNKGFGKATMKKALSYCMSEYGDPTFVTYTWNGANAYVLDWLEGHFDAVCNCPIAVQKTQSDDDWDSHIYDLNVQKVLNYFGIQKG